MPISSLLEIAVFFAPFVLTYLWLRRRPGAHRFCRLGFATALLTMFLVLWVNLAVGIVGDTDNPINLLYASVLLLAVVLSISVKLKEARLAGVFITLAMYQLFVGATTFALTSFADRSSEGIFVAVLNLGLLGLWLFASWSFRRCSKSQNTA